MKRRRIILIVAIGMFLFLPLVITDAATINANSCSYADVSAAINSAQSGDIVNVPAGNCTWNSQLVITKGIVLKGAGIDSTIITGNYAGGNMGDAQDRSNFLIAYDPANPSLDEPFRLSGLTLDLGGTCLGVEVRVSAPNYNTPLTKIRLDHLKIYNTPAASPGGGGFSVFIKGPIFGVADNNILMGGSIETTGWSAQAWASTDSRISSVDYGTQYFFFWEDNTLIPIKTGSTFLVVYGGNGMKYVFRHNIIDGSGVPNGFSPLIDFHGTQGTGSTNLGMFGGEVYENTITSAAGVLLNQRGGKVLCYNNAATGSTWKVWPTEEHCDYETTGPYTSVTSGQPEHITDSYYWGNTRNGGRITLYEIKQTVNYDEVHPACRVDHSGYGTGIVPRKDVHVWFEPDLTNNYTFDGSSGVGLGSLSARPATCTIGVGYWANDTKILYKCNSTNSWVAYYTPYTYPHPLRTDCVSYPTLCDSVSEPPADITPPSAPTGVMVN